MLAMAEPPRRPPVMPVTVAPRHDLPAVRVPKPPPVPQVVEEPPSVRTISQHPAYDTPTPKRDEELLRGLENFVAKCVDTAVAAQDIPRQVREEVAAGLQRASAAAGSQPDPRMQRLERELAQERAANDRLADLLQKQATVKRTDAEARNIEAQAQRTNTEAEEAPAKIRTEKWKAIAAIVTAIGVVLGTLGVASWLSQCRGPTRDETHARAADGGFARH